VKHAQPLGVLAGKHLQQELARRAPPGNFLPGKTDVLVVAETNPVLYRASEVRQRADVRDAVKDRRKRRSDLVYRRRRLFAAVESHTELIDRPHQHLGELEALAGLDRFVQSAETHADLFQRLGHGFF
jgi:hypothetical protein